MKQYTIETDYGTYNDIAITTDHYRFDGSLAIELVSESEGPFARLTVCLQDDLGLPYFLDEDEAFVDTNNCPWAEEFIKENRLGKPTGRTARSGWCEYPLYKFNLKKLHETFTKKSLQTN